MFPTMKKHKTVFFLAAFAVVFLLASFICADFVMRTNQNAHHMSSQIAVSNTYTRAEDLAFSLEDHFTNLELLAENASDYDDYNDTRLKTLLNRFGEYHGNSSVFIADTNGTAYNTQISVKDRDYFKKALSGKRAISQVITSRHSKKPSIVMAVPVFRAKKVMGVLMNIYQSTQLDQLLHLSDMPGTEHMFIVQKDGAIILSGENQKIGGSMEEVLETYLQGDPLEKLLLNLRTSVSGSGSLDFENKSGFYNCSYAPVDENYWFLFNISDTSSLDTYTRKSSQNGIHFMIKIAFLLLLIAAAIIWMIHLNQKKVREMSRVLEGVTNHAPGGMFSFLPNSGEFSFINDGLYEMLGYTKEEFQEKYENKFFNLICEEDREAALADLSRNLKNGTTSKIRYRVETRQHGKFWVQQVSNLFVYREYRIVYGMLMDIEEYKEFEDELYLSNQRYKILVNQRESCFLEFRTDNMELLNCENFAEIFDRSIPKDTDMGLSFLHPDDVAVVRERVQLIRGGNAAYSQCEARIANGQKQYLWCLVRFYLLLDEHGSGRRVICKINDIDQRKRRAVDLENRAMKDPLTSLLNKVVTQEQITAHLAEEPENIQALFVLDIDNFKAINDKYGHNSGDQILLLMAETVHSLFRISDVTGRFGGDEFVVYMKDCFDESYAAKKGEQLREEFYARCRRKGYTISCSIGCALYPKDGTTWKELFNNADMALYESKAKGRNCLTVYNSRS